MKILKTLFFLLLFPCLASASPITIDTWDFVGGTTGTLDKWYSSGANLDSGAAIESNSRAIIATSSGYQVFVYDSTDTNSESVSAPYNYIIPDDAPSSGRWIGIDPYIVNITTFLANKLGLTVTATELDYVAGVTSAIQTQLDGKQATITTGSLPDKSVVRADTEDAINWTRETFTTDADPYTITPTGDWDDYKDYYCIVTTHQADVTLRLSKTGPPANQCKAHVYITSGYNGDMDDVDGQQELIPDGVTKTLEIGEWKVFIYDTDRWTEYNKSANEKFATITTTEVDIIPIGYVIDGASAPDAIETITSGTDKVQVRTFSGSADEDVVFDWEVPDDIVTADGVKFAVVTYVTESTAPSSETWQFELQGFCIGDGDPLDGTLGTAGTSNSGSRSDAQYDRLQTAWSSAITITDLAKGETTQLKLYRDVDDNDSYAQLIGASHVKIKYKRTHDISF